MWCVNTNMLQIVPTLTRQSLSHHKTASGTQSINCRNVWAKSYLGQSREKWHVRMLKASKHLQLPGLYRCVVYIKTENHYNNVQSCQEVMVLSKLLLNCSLNLNFLSLEELSGNFQRFMSWNFHTYSVSLFVTLQYCTELFGNFKFTSLFTGHNWNISIFCIDWVIHC